MHITKHTLAIVIVCLIGANLAGQKIIESRDKMGSPFTITIATSDSSGAKQTINEAFVLVDNLIKVYSDYDPTSELSTINRSKCCQPISISQDLARLLVMSQKACLQSNGAFDVTMRRLTHYWKRKIKSETPISKDSIAILRKDCGCHQYNIDTISSTIIKKNNLFAFDLGGIAKGYIAQRVSDLLKPTFPCHLIDAGGDLVVGDAPPGTDGWRIAIESELYENEVISIQNRAIATSGSTYQHLDEGGVRYSHIIQPKNGIGIKRMENITIIASTGQDADWLATACSIISDRKAKKLLKSMKAVKM